MYHVISTVLSFLRSRGPVRPALPARGQAGRQNKQARGVSRAAESPLQQDVTSGCDITGRAQRLFAECSVAGCNAQLETLSLCLSRNVEQPHCSEGNTAKKQKEAENGEKQ